ncbi:MAG TPA: flagellar hook-basal body complex protein [Bacillota bacterium]|nr:flagellar hook-basal body complex protein [Bacillota bacterium]
MIRGLYTAATGMIVQERKMENVSQNLANVETGAFKRQEVLARSYDNVNISNKANSPDNRRAPIGQLQLGVMIDDVHTDFDQGQLNQTNKPLDLAIDGDGFFTILLPNGQHAYSRDGSFTVNREGLVTTKKGYPVLDTQMRGIYVDTEDIAIDERGLIRLADGSTAQLNIVDFPEIQTLDKLGENMYTVGVGQLVQADEFILRQGFLEQSNINPLDELVKMIEISRSFESNQRVIQSLDETLGKAVNEVGRL